MIPDNISSHILNKCKFKRGVIQVVGNDGKLRSSLEFDENGHSKTLTDSIYVLGYINRIVKYGRKRDFKILVDGIPLDELPVSLGYDCGESGDGLAS